MHMKNNAKIIFLACLKISSTVRYLANVTPAA